MRNMTVKKIISSSLVSFITGVGLIMVAPYLNYYGSVENLFEVIVQVLLFFSLSFFFTSLILLFRPQAIFHSWLRFTKYYLPIALLLILTSGDTGGGMFIGFGGGFDREGMIWFTAGLFFVISLLLIIIKSWKLRRK